jgi:DNA-binding SARP family transcriptional activator
MTAGVRPSFYLKTLGELSLHAEGPLGPPLLRNSKPLAVLAYLATTPNRSARRDHVAQLLWPDSDPSHARSSLRQALFYISQRVGRALIHTHEATIALDTSLLAVDIWRFERELDSGDFAHVVELYTGPFAPGLERKAGAELEGWIESQDEQLRAGLEVAYTRLVSDQLAKGDADEAVAYARRYVELNPLNERAQLALIRALKAANDQVGALQAYRSFRSLLREALDGEPSDELERAIASVRDEVLREPSEDETAVPIKGRPGKRLRRWIAVGGAIGAAALIITVHALQGWGPWRNPATRIFDGLPGDLFVIVGTAGSPEFAAGRVNRGGFDFEPTTYPHKAIPSPDGELVALQVAATDGRNLAVMDRGSAAMRTLTRETHDELQLGWSPDGQFILYRQGRLLEGGRDYNHDLMAHDLESGRDLLISDMRSPKAYDAAWSPDGTRIAFVAEATDERELYVAEADGSNPTRLAIGLVEQGRLAWSPDNQHIAFVVADENGAGDIFTIHPNGSGLRQLTESVTAETSPLWFTENLLGFVLEQPDESRDVWVMDVRGGPIQRVTEHANVRAAIAYIAADAPQGWIEGLSIVPQIGVVAPGQYMAIDVEAVDATGGLVESVDLPLRWSLSDSTLGRFVSPNLLRIQTTGSALLVVSAGGWIVDTLEIRSREIVEGPATLLLYEDWSRRINGDRWMRWGNPLPEARPTGGPEGAGIFINNGDHHHSSGVVSRQAFSPREGLTIQFWASMPVTGKLYETFSVGLAAEIPTDSAEWDVMVLEAEFMMEGSLFGTDSAAVIMARLVPSYLPSLPAPEQWHHYTLQIDRDGLISLLIDGRLYWRVPSNLPVQDMAPLHVVLSGRSVDSEIAHGLVRVYYGSKYHIPTSSPSPEAPLAR